MFKKGQQVLCIDAGEDNKYRLTVGKYYLIEYDHNSKVYIKNDKGVSGNYWAGRFNHVQQIREEKLKQLGIE
jgi:hypothetical protein